MVEPLPPLLRGLIERLVSWGILPEDKKPDSAIINIYEAGMCIPPHIDHHDFERPFVTLSLLSEQSILFGSRLVPEPTSDGKFMAKDCPSLSIPLPVGKPLTSDVFTAQDDKRRPCWLCCKTPRFLTV